MYNRFKKPKTLNVMRQNALVEADSELRELGVKVRAKRRSQNLPNIWWDEHRTDALARSWKHNRRTQYRAAA